jgi:hypothetical protein
MQNEPTHTKEEEPGAVSCAAWLESMTETIVGKTGAELYAEPLQSTFEAAKTFERELGALLAKVPLAGPCAVSSGTVDAGWTVKIKLSALIQRLERDLSELE